MSIAHTIGDGVSSIFTVTEKRQNKVANDRTNTDDYVIPDYPCKGEDALKKLEEVIETLIAREKQGRRQYARRRFAKCDLMLPVIVSVINRKGDVMAKIKWVGIIKDISIYQKGELPEKAVILNMPKTISRTMVKALPFIAVPLSIIILSMFLKTYLHGEPVISFPFLIIGLITGILFSFIHELLHAVVYPKNAVVYIGFVPKSCAAVALASYPLSKIRFTVMSLLPTLLGIIPIVLFWIMPPNYFALNGFLFGFAVFGLISPYPDFYNVFQIFRQAPRKCLIQFYGDDTYYIVETKK